MLNTRRAGWPALIALGAIVLSNVATADLAGIVPEGAEVEQAATGFRFTEGPAWGSDGMLYFSDIPADQILKLDAEGTVSVFLEPSRNSNGLMADEDGTLIACRHDGRDVVRISPDGEVHVLADQYDGGKLNSPNDCIIAADGTIYFTDPHYGLAGREREQDCEGVDGKTLYVADSEDRKIRAYTLTEDDSASDGRDFGDMHTDKEGVPDGMTLDEEGNVYCTGGGGIWVFAPDGEHLGMIEVPEVPANCTFGGPENKTLYITARTSVYRIELAIAGLR